MRIVIINGLFRFNNQLGEKIARAMQERFRSDCVVIEGLWCCLPMQIPRMLGFIEYLAGRYDDGIETLFVGHSMGGIFACALDRRLVNTPIRGIVTVFSPHTYCNGMYPVWLGADRELKAPIISFEAAHDMLVIYGARHRQSQEHVKLDCNHRTDLESDPEISRLIAHKTWRHFA